LVGPYGNDKNLDVAAIREAYQDDEQLLEYGFAQKYFTE